MNNPFFCAGCANYDDMVLSYLESTPDFVSAIQQGNSLTTDFYTCEVSVGLLYRVTGDSPCEETLRSNIRVHVKTHVLRNNVSTCLLQDSWLFLYGLCNLKYLHSERVQPNDLFLKV